MEKIYFYINALLYLGLALWCTVQHPVTARASGYLQLDASGHSEYLAIYGGLQWGLALFYAYLASRPEFFSLGVRFSLFLYAPIVLYRLITVLTYWPVSHVTLGTGVLELILLGWSICLLRR